MAYRLGETEAERTSREEETARVSTEGEGGKGVGARRVAGELGRMGVKAVATSGHTLAVTNDGRWAKPMLCSPMGGPD